MRKRFSLKVMREATASVATENDLFVYIYGPCLDLENTLFSSSHFKISSSRSNNPPSGCFLLCNCAQVFCMIVFCMTVSVLLSHEHSGS